MTGHFWILLLVDQRKSLKVSLHISPLSYVKMVQYLLDLPNDYLNLQKKNNQKLFFSKQNKYYEQNI